MLTKTKIRLPYKFSPRPYQLPLLDAMDSGCKRAVCIWHRRAGKDKCLINLMANMMMKRVGVYYYVFPTYQQGKKILWEGIDKDGFKFTDHLPKELRYRTNDSEMLIQLVHPSEKDEKGKPAPGSIFRIIGSDNIDSIVGTNPVGVVFSEYSLQDPRAWDYLRPILAENEGWAIFNYTPRGHNHGYDLWNMAQKYPRQWFTQKLTVADTGVIKPEVLLQEKAEMYEKTKSDALYMQEYFVSFDAPVEGSYFGAWMMEADKEGRITNVPWEPTVPVDTYWDLGIDDSMSIWFVQTVGREVRCIEYMEVTGEGLQYCIKELRNKRYTYGEHYAPHDINVRELTSGVSRKQTAQSLGINFRVIPRMKMKEDGIEAARNILPRVWFDKTKCARGIQALNSYQKEWDEKNKVYRNHPLHNWASHGADSFQQLGLGYKAPIDDNEVVDETPLFDDDGFYR